MAWIKLRTDLLNDPAVYKMAAVLRIDRFSLVGRLAAFWGWADQHAVDGAVDGASSQVVDDVVSLVGFSDAMVSVKWLKLEADRIVIPNHDRHNGANAKERSLKSERQAKWRAKTPSEKPSKHVDGAVDGQPSTREEKRREEKIEDSVAKATGGKPPMSPDEIIFGYGVPLLVNAGSTDKAARSFLGGLRKVHGDEAVVNGLRDCIRAKPLQPLEWLAAALPPHQATHPKANAQEALEASNKAVAARFLENDHARHG
jgi:hypothetical protein